MNHSVGVILIEGDKVLLVKHSSGSAYTREVYGAPAGRIDPNETEKQAAVREFHEETGLTTSEEELQEFENNYYSAELDRKNGKETWSIRFFRAERYQGELKPSEEGTPEWIRIENLKQMDVLPNVIEGIEASQREWTKVTVRPKMSTECPSRASFKGFNLVASRGIPPISFRKGSLHSRFG